MKATSAVSLVLAVIVVSVSLAGCKDRDEAKDVLPKVCANFPDSVIYKFDKRVLWIQTHIDGVNDKVAETMFQQGCQQAAYPIGKLRINIATELNFDQRSLLVIGLRKYVIAWEVRNGVDERGIPRNYEVMTWPEAHDWFTQHLGYMPTPDQIMVITQQDVEDTPQGQQMQLQTLADIQKQKRQQLQEQLQQQSER